MARRLTKGQIEEIMKCFEDGANLDFLSQKFKCTKLTVIRNLKKNLGEIKYKQFLKNNKSSKVKSKANNNRNNGFKKTNFDDADLIKDSKDSKVLNQNITSSNFAPSDSFLEIAPIDYEIDNSPRKELSSVPISEVDFPKVVYMIVDKKIELEIKLLKDFPEWDFLSLHDLDRKTIEIFLDLNIARRFCNKDQKVLKVPNTDVFRIAAPILVGKGISRIVCADNLIAL